MIATLLLLSATQVFRLELPENGNPLVVGVDGVRREVVLVSPEEYCALTNNVIETWKKIHQTEEGRVKVHGKRVNTSVTNKTVRVDTYQDGFKMHHKMSPRHLEFRAKLDVWKKKQPTEIAVEHDAATGKDKVVK